MSLPAIGLLVLVASGGALIAAQGPIYVRMASVVGGPLPAATLAFAIGTAALTLAMLATATPWPSRTMLVSVPLWVWLGGLIGAFVVLVSIFAVPRLGVASYAVFVIAGQLGASYIYDRVGLSGIVREFSSLNVLGLTLVLVGAALATVRGG